MIRASIIIILFGALSLFAHQSLELLPLEHALCVENNNNACPQGTSIYFTIRGCNCFKASDLYASSQCLSTRICDQDKNEVFRWVHTHNPQNGRKSLAGCACFYMKN
jgi:hypothetical protein